MSEKNKTMISNKYYLTLTGMLIIFLFPKALQAHGVCRQFSTANIELDVSADKVWNIIKNFSDLSWHPMVKSLDAVTNENIKGASRIFTLTTGGQVTQELKGYNEGRLSFKYRSPISEMTILKTISFKGKNVPIRSFPILEQSGYINESIRVSSLQDHKSIVLWRAIYYNGYCYWDIPLELSLPSADNAILKFMETGLQGIAKKLKISTEESKIDKYIAIQ